MAWENPIGIDSFSAGGTIVANRFLKISGADNTVVQSAASTDDSIGVAAAAASSGDAVAVKHTGIVKVEAGAAVTRGAQVMSDSSGRAVNATATNKVVGVALEASSGAGEIISVKLGAAIIL